MPDKLFNPSILTVGFNFFITISEFRIKCVVSYIAHDMRDRVELVTHCFSQYVSVTRMYEIFAACESA